MTTQILAKIDLLNYFEGLIENNKLEEEYNKFFPIPFGPYYDSSLRYNKDEGWKEIRKTLFHNLESLEKVYFYDFLISKVREQKIFTRKSFKFHIQNEDDDSAKFTFKQQVLNDLKNLKKAAKSNLVMLREFHLLTETINELTKEINEYPIGIEDIITKQGLTIIPKIKWNADREFFFLIFSQLYDNQCLSLQEGKVTKAKIAALLFNSFDLENKKNNDEISASSIVTKLNSTVVRDNYIKKGDTTFINKFDTFIKTYKNFI